MSIFFYYKLVNKIVAIIVIITYLQRKPVPDTTLIFNNFLQVYRKIKFYILYNLCFNLYFAINIFMQNKTKHFILLLKKLNIIKILFKNFFLF